MKKNEILRAIKKVLVENETHFSNSDYTLGWIAAIVNTEIEKEKSRGRGKHTD